MVAVVVKYILEPNMKWAAERIADAVCNHLNQYDGFIDYKFMEQVEAGLVRAATSSCQEKL